MTQSFSGRQVVVTGGASGFGRGIAEAFVDRGASVTLLDINQSLLLETTEALSAKGNVSGITCDITHGDQVQETIASLPRIDVFINNAGVTHLPAPLEDIEAAEFDRVWQVNMRAIYLISREVVPKMKQAGGGVILNIASTAGISPRPNLTWYNASKGWLITATKSMAAELAPAGIRVNAICPVAGETPLLSSFMGEDTPEMREKFLATIPLGRFSTPDDVGATACFLASDEASMLTGVALEVDGGRCI